MLNLLDKVFEIIILKTLNQYTEENGILQREKLGFRKYHSTLLQLKRIVNLIQDNKSKKWGTGVVFLDIEKVFDSIRHYGLIYKLEKFVYPVYLQKLIKSF